VFGTVIGFHYVVTNRSKIKADNIKLLWERIDALEAKLTKEINERDSFIYQLQARISQLEKRLRDYGIPLPTGENDETQPLPKPRGFGMKQ